MEKWSHRNKPNTLSETWPWDRVWIRFTLWVTGVLGILLTGIAYLYYGTVALWLLSICVWGIFFAGMNNFVGKKVQTIADNLKKEEGELIDGLIVIGMKHAPGIILLKNDEIILAPIIGEQLPILLNTIKSVTQRTCLPGKKLYGKKAFYLDVPGQKAIAFAVASSIASRWSAKLSF